MSNPCMLCIFPSFWQVLLPAERDTFLSDDLDLVESVELQKRINYIVNIIEEVEWPDVDPDDLTR